AALGGSPLIMAMGFLAIFPVVAWVYGLVSWMVMGEVDPLFGVPGILVGLTLGYVAMAPPEPVYSPLALACLVGTMIVFPIAKRHLDRRAMIQIEILQIESAYRVLAIKPDHAPAKFKLAESLYARGLVGPAIGVGEAALAGMPKSLFPEENVTVGRWKAQAKGSELQRQIPCLECGRPNKAGAIHCERCGSPFLSAYARGRWLGPSLARKLVASWVAAAVALVGLPLTLGTDLVTGWAAFAAAALQAALVAVLLWRAFGRRGAAR
ncbi:MAG: zinc ribbon domain-containing protein, partial [Armatimonadetes bacterium]|nr:zinc ribbon domain-containing protein [Armatimonadota bacterium]